MTASTGNDRSQSCEIPSRPLGKTGLEVSIISLGGGHLARPHLTPEMSVGIIQEAVDCGVTFIDTAWEYWGGESERRIGLALKGRRDKVVLMTKVCARDRRTAEQQLDESLRRLQTDVIDVWQFHEINYDNDPDLIFASDGAIEAAVRARQAGKVRFIGFTGHKSPHIMLWMLQQDFEWDTCQFPVSVLDFHYRSFEHELLPELNRRGIAGLGMKSLGGESQYLEVAGLTAERCRRYALSQPISTLICGCQSLDDLRSNVQIGRRFTPMSESELSQLRDAVRDEAGDGRWEWFKSTQNFDSQYHRDQHSFPPVGGVRNRSKQ